VCQPTVFFRRDTFMALGGLDVTLRTAFDYEFWLRVWKQHAGQIAFVPQVQALSRLHAGGITLRMREQVALEGLSVVRRHVGPAPVHWLLTYASEALAPCPFDADPTQVRAHLLALAAQAGDDMVADGVSQFRQHLSAHRGWQLARTGFTADVHADGWAPPATALRILQPALPWRRLRLWCRHASPRGGPLRLALIGADGRTLWDGGAAVRGPFSTVLPLPASAPGDALRLTLRSQTHFVPADVDARSTDRRELAFQIDAAELLT
jgi:hypothetical protein